MQPMHVCNNAQLSAEAASVLHLTFFLKQQEAKKQ
jgi:hypothetical protein